ncbi:methyltransferase domain-containing protein [Flavobacteriaceae bacterium Ap0902]|nr:methyltransferase domain-containing protein [Flavobacteriaceae bacterium Ap0902]
MISILKTALNTIPRPWLIRLSYWARPILILWLKGDKFQDPIDGKTYRKLLSYGYAKTRENVLAPGSLSLERHRLMWLYLQNETDFFTADLKVLHIAPEQSFLSKFKKMKNLEYTTLDIESPIADIKADIRNLPLENNSYDVIFCNHVLEHIVEDEAAMKELYRVMKPGGWGIFQVPMKYNLKTTYEDFSITSPEERQKHFGQYDHVRWYGLDYFEKLRNVGFKVRTDYGTGNFTSDEQQKFALMSGEVLPVVLK